MDLKPKIIKCRGIIVINDKILLAKHGHNERDFYAFLGGHLEGDENPVACARREITEELGIKPEIGRLMYINLYSENENDYIEFFFEVKNSQDYLDIHKFNGTHSNELIEIVWVNKNQDISVMPKVIFDDFNNDRLHYSKDVIFL